MPGHLATYLVGGYAQLTSLTVMSLLYFRLSAREEESRVIVIAGYSGLVHEASNVAVRISFSAQLGILHALEEATKVRSLITTVGMACFGG